MVARFFIHHRLKHLPETGNCLWTSGTISGAHPVALGVR
jgi:hypothetical protein